MTDSLADLRAEAVRLREWMFRESFPLWAGPGMHTSGAAWEALDFVGIPVPNNAVRVRVQARQVFVFSLAHSMGWEPDRSRELVESLLGHLLNGCRRDDGLFGKVYDLESQTLIDDTFCLYDTAFALLALAEASRPLGKDRVAGDIAAIFAALDRHVAHPDGGYQEDGAASADRLQNPHMHLFESLLAIGEAGFDDDGNAVGGFEHGAESRASRLLAFIESRFFDEHLGIVRERRPGKDCDPVTFEPGHSFEWTWLLSWWAGRQGVGTNPFAEQLFTKAERTLDNQGFACMEASVDGAKTDSTCRLWAQAEVLKALLCRAMATQGAARADYVARAVDCCRGMAAHWLEPAHPGGWFDHFDQSGERLAQDMPASTGYHLFGAVRFLEESLTRLA